MTLIRDLIDIPERVHRDDFVLRLAEGVTKPAETLRTYVVTPQLADAFDRALDLIKGALASGSSKAAYLHGSFGSGKSHFMAVLHLLLQQNAAARATEGLEGVVTRHDDWLVGKQFLLVPYHMIGKPSLEAAVLGGYAARVSELHPDAPAPGVYRSEGLFEDARRLRAQIGDETFFARLNETAASTGEGAAGWGDLSAHWDAASFEAALGAPAGAEERSRLVAALIDSFFRGYRDVARGSDEAFVPLDEGLAVIARHARDLGYDALVLFLDELILWLATHAADLQFLNEEGPKVSKLVEAETAGRPIPIVSFVARQRDLRELVGEQVTGALQLGFADVLQWWEARFERIALDDRNLPEIAARRLLRPRNHAAHQEIDRAYAETGKVRREVFEDAADPARRQRDVSQGLPLQSRARRNPGRRLVAPPARADCAEGDAPDPGGRARGARPGRDRPGRRPVRCHRRRRRAVHRGHAPPLRERAEPLSPEDPAAHRAPARHLQGGCGDAPQGRQGGACPARGRSTRKNTAAVSPGARGRGAEEPDRDAARGAQSRVDPDADRGTRRPGGAAALPRLGRRDRGDPDW